MINSIVTAHLKNSDDYRAEIVSLMPFLTGTQNIESLSNSAG